MGSGRLRQVNGAFLAIAAALDFVVEALVLIQGVHPRRLDGGNVHEAVGRAIVRLDEAIALVSVKELDGANLGHGVSFQETEGGPATKGRTGRASGRKMKGSRRLVCAGA